MGSLAPSPAALRRAPHAAASHAAASPRRTAGPDHASHRLISAFRNLKSREFALWCAPTWRVPAVATAAVVAVSPPPWRLAQLTHPALADLLTSIEGAWLAAGAVAVPLDEVRREMDEKGRSQAGTPQPPRTHAVSRPPLLSSSPQDIAYKDSHDGGAAAPSSTLRLRVENRVYTIHTLPAFRKLHLELALRSDGLAVLHGVAFPWAAFDLPILAFDLVATTKGMVKKSNDGETPTSSSPPSSLPVSLAIIDPCPVSADRSLPAPYADAVAALQASRPGGSASNRATPEWGASIFSDACVLARPGSDGGAVAAFNEYAAALNELHLAYAATLVGDGGSGTRPPPNPATLAAHGRWADHQLRNDRTRRVLAVAFGEGWADSYMREVMFDVEGSK